MTLSLIIISYQGRPGFGGIWYPVLFNNEYTVHLLFEFSSIGILDFENLTYTIYVVDSEAGKPLMVSRVIQSCGSYQVLGKPVEFPYRIPSYV